MYRYVTDFFFIGPIISYLKVVHHIPIYFIGIYDCYNQLYEYVFSLYFRECQNSNNQKAMSLYVAINLKKEKKEEEEKYWDVHY